jgi:hypothetical protein
MIREAPRAIVRQMQESESDPEAAQDPAKVLPEAYAVRADTRTNEPCSEQYAPSHGAPAPGDNIITNDDEDGSLPTGWCLLPWFSFLFCFMPVVSLVQPANVLSLVLILDVCTRHVPSFHCSRRYHQPTSHCNASLRYTHQKPVILIVQVVPAGRT